MPFTAIDLARRTLIIHVIDIDTGSAESFFKLTVYLTFTIWAISVSYKEKYALKPSQSTALPQRFPHRIYILQVSDRYQVLLARLHKAAM